jgi:CMP-N-acetylneuraminic acid synthetase
MQFSFAQKNALEAAFEQVGMDIVYAGIPMEFQAGGGGAGYDNVKASPSVVVATASQVGQYITVQCIGTNKNGKEVVLGEKKYLVKPTPKPNLYLGDFEDGATLDSIPAILNIKLGDDIPFDKSKTKFDINSYSISVSGVKGSLDGAGNTISEAHLKILSGAARGSAFSIQVKYSGTSQGIASAMFKGSSKLGLKADKEQFIADLKALHTLLKEKKYEEAADFFVFPGLVSNEEIKNAISKLIEQSEISDKGIELLSANGSFGSLRSIFPNKAENWINDIGFTFLTKSVNKLIADKNGNALSVYMKKGNSWNGENTFFEIGDERMYQLTKDETTDISEAELQDDNTPIMSWYYVYKPLYAMKLGSAEVAGVWNGEHFQFFRLDDVGKLK